MKFDFIKTKVKKLYDKELIDFFFDSSKYISAELVVKGLYFLSIPIVTRILTPDEYGILSIYLSLINIFVVILMLNLKTSVIRYSYENKNDFDSFLGTVFIVIGLFNILALPFVIYFKEYISLLLGIPKEVFMYVLITAFLMIPYQIYRSYLIPRKKSRNYSIISILYYFSILLLMFIIISFLKEDKYLGEIYSRIIITIIFNIFIYIRLKTNIILKFSKKHFQYALKFSLPLLLGTLSGFILNFFDRIMINKMVDSQSVGIYSLSYNIGMAMFVVVYGSNKSWGPFFFKNINNSKYKLINEVAKKYIKIILLIATFLVLFSEELILIMADKNYSEAKNILSIIIIGYIFNYFYTLYTNYLEYYKQTYKISINIFLSGIINVVLNYFLIPIYGYKIAAMTTLISYAFLFVMTYIAAKKINKKIIPLNLLLFPFSIFIFFIIIYYCLQNILINNIIFLKVGILLSILIIFFRKELKKYLNTNNY